ncbi:MAG: hypothetical protein R6X16_15590 [Anaerolineae bacterium]
MEVVSAIDARLVEYAHSLWQVEQVNSVRLNRGETESFFRRTLSRLGR